MDRSAATRVPTARGAAALVGRRREQRCGTRSGTDQRTTTSCCAAPDGRSLLESGVSVVRTESMQVLYCGTLFCSSVAAASFARGSDTKGQGARRRIVFCSNMCVFQRSAARQSCAGSSWRAAQGVRRRRRRSSTASHSGGGIARASTASAPAHHAMHRQLCGAAKAARGACTNSHTQPQPSSIRFSSCTACIIPRLVPLRARVVSAAAAWSRRPRPLP